MQRLESKEEEDDEENKIHVWQGKRIVNRQELGLNKKGVLKKMQAEDKKRR